VDRDEVERKLAAILAADVAGYSRLMGADEEGTLRTLKRHRAELIDPKITEHHGRIVKTTGDGLLVEFPSVVDAVRCGAEMQLAMAARNRETPEERRIEFRLGVNLGDVIVDGGDIYGDGVNVAARLEGLAEPGGICISRAARDQVRDRLDLELEDLGEQNVKNIARPVRVFRVVLESGGGPPASALELPDKPSIAVLPFANMSGDAEQEYFAEGISEDIITELSRFNSVFVIARNSSFTYKGRDVKVQEVARDLGVEYVVEGSVRKAGNRVRVTAQLIEAASGNHLWAERYDRDLEDIFAVQDEVTQTVVATVAGRLEAAEMERTKRKPTERLAAYDYLLQGKDLHHRVTKEANAEGLEMLEKAIELDPDFAEAHAWLACTLGQSWARGWAEQGEETLDRCRAEIRAAHELDAGPGPQPQRPPHRRAEGLPAHLSGAVRGRRRVGAKGHAPRSLPLGAELVLPGAGALYGAALRRGGRGLDADQRAPGGASGRPRRRQRPPGRRCRGQGSGCRHPRGRPRFHRRRPRRVVVLRAAVGQGPPAPGPDRGGLAGVRAPATDPAPYMARAARPSGRGGSSSLWSSKRHLQ
jgi:adenylate cyclase